jgi:hypothetical protein
VDADGDGFFNCIFDCDDSDAGVHPNALCAIGQVCQTIFDQPCDGIDKDCSITNGEGCEPLTSSCINPNPCAGSSCGTVSDLCGGTISCGTCGTGQTCFGNQCCFPNALSCTVGFTPEFEPIDSCGVLFDSCGGSLDCRGCEEGYACNQNTLLCEPLPPGPTPPPCVPDCADNKICGTPDGCGGICNYCSSGLCEERLLDLGPGVPPLKTGYCKQFCDEVQISCGSCIESIFPDGKIITKQLQCPSGYSCLGAICVTETSCPQGCKESETCDVITNQCKCGDDVCTSTQLCTQGISGSGQPHCCNVSNFLCF